MGNTISFFKEMCKQIRYVKILISLLQKWLNFWAIQHDIQCCWFALHGSEPMRYDLFSLTTRLIENWYQLQMRRIHIVLMMIRSVSWTSNFITKIVWTKLRSFSCTLCLFLGPLFNFPIALYNLKVRCLLYLKNICVNLNMLQMLTIRMDTST